MNRDSENSPAGLPTVTLNDGDLYWIKPAYGDGAGLWTIGRWEHGCWWGIKGQEVTPRVISGPIPRPDEAAEASQ